MKTKFLYVFFLFLVTLSCSKDDEIVDDRTPELSENIISGKVELPSNSTLSINTMNIVSVADVTNITNNNYEIEIIPNEFTTQMVMNTSNEVFLMGYNYPNQEDFTINSKSTALAIMMNLLPSLLMESKGKQELIDKIINHPNFENLGAKIDDILSQDISPLSISDNSLAQEIANFYEEIFSIENKNQTKIGEDEDYPVEVYQSGKEITFVNPGKSYETVIGVYKDDQKIHTMNVPRVTFAPTGVGDVIGALASAEEGEIPTGLQPIEEIYTMVGDGEFEFIIRNGFFANGIDSENFEAYIRNLINWNLDFLLQILPTKGMGDCVQSLIADMLEFAQTSVTMVESNPKAGEVLGLIYNFLSEFLGQSPVVSSCFAKEVVETSFLKGLSKLLAITKLVGVLGNAGNLVFGIGQWVYDDGAFEKCYNVNNENVSECDADFNVYVAGGTEYLSGKALLWKNGVLSELYGPSNAASANAVLVSNNNLYVGGNSSPYIATIWENGIPENITEEGNTVNIKDIYVSNNDIYAVGSFYAYATLWKNGQKTNLIKGGDYAEALGVEVFDSDVYVVGFDYSPMNSESIKTGRFWKNGILNNLEGGTSNTTLSDIEISNGDIYIVGYKNRGNQNIIKIWKNGNLFQTINGNDISANALFISEDIIYVCGSERNGSNIPVAKVWKNGVASELTNGTYLASANDIQVFEGDTYVVGYERNENNFSVAKMWKNEEVTELSDGSSSVYAKGIYISSSN